MALGDEPPKTPPIVEPGFLYGPKVVSIGDIRVARGLSRRPHSSCPHHRMVYDRQERRVWCKDCEQDVEAFDAYMLVVEQFAKAEARIDRLNTEALEASKFSLISRAAKAIDRQWRRRNMVPTCPHCSAGIWPEDALNMGAVNEWDKARRNRVTPTR